MHYDRIIFDNPRFPVSVLPFYASAKHTLSKNLAVPRYHEALEILYFLDGETGVIVKDRTFSCKKGDIIIINPHELHAVYKISGDVCYHCVMIDSIVFSAKDDVTNEKYILPLESQEIIFDNYMRDDALASSILTIVNEMGEKKDCYELAVKAAVYNILTILNRQHVEATLSKKEHEMRLKHLYTVEQGVDYIKKHLKNQITLKDISRELSVSEYHFSRMFKKQTGLTVFEYIESQRMELAKTLLQTPSKTVSQIAYECGYNESAYFSKVFKAHTGLSPREYIKQVKFANE